MKKILTSKSLSLFFMIATLGMIIDLQANVTIGDLQDRESWDYQDYRLIRGKGDCNMITVLFQGESLLAIYRKPLPGVNEIEEFEIRSSQLRNPEAVNLLFYFAISEREKQKRNER